MTTAEEARRKFEKLKAQKDTEKTRTATENNKLAVAIILAEIKKGMVGWLAGTETPPKWMRKEGTDKFPLRKG